MTASPRILMPQVPVLVAGLRGSVLLETDGECLRLSPSQAAQRARSDMPLVCHGPAVAARLRIDRFDRYDILELFAFVRPARFCLPTPRGVAEALGLLTPLAPEDEAETLRVACRRLLEDLSAGLAVASARRVAEVRGLAWMMARGGWNWGAPVLAALGVEGEGGRGIAAIRVWERLPEWNESAPEPPAGSLPVAPAEARARLAAMLGEGAEQRSGQADYASAVSQAFLPRDDAGEPHLVLAEAGTGTGKTLGYIAPASLWAERNGAPVWISTHTRNLQRQLDVELDRLYPDPVEKARKVVIRKGRENYVCLLNYEEFALRDNVRAAVAVGLVARWIGSTRDGDMVGGDFPGWLVDLLGRGSTLGLTDRRGECVFSACFHYRKCFIERAVRRARRADIVVANHALVMIQAALGGLDDGAVPTRLVFDEGHHVFDVADSAFSMHLTGLEGVEMRRWLLGPEGDGGRSRARGLSRRAEDLVGGSEEAALALDQALAAARLLPGPGWVQRLSVEEPQGPAEIFLAQVRRQVMARSEAPDSAYSLETATQPPVEGLAVAAQQLAAALVGLEQPLQVLAKALAALLDDEAAELDSSTRSRIEGICRGIQRRVVMPLGGWKNMLATLAGAPEAAEASQDTAKNEADPVVYPDRYVDWLAVERIEGREVDIGLHRHWLDPSFPFARAVMAPAHGVVITSATLRDGSGEPEADWRAAERRIGGSHLSSAPLRAAVTSPFDYPASTRVLIVTDVRKDDMDQVAAAYRELFLAAGGGGLGLFTAISRLREVHRRIGGPLEDAGLPLLAQHVDAMDTATLVDIFRAEQESCLLGTDAMRDGVDVPGRSLRLIVFDRVPWPRPDILHRARRDCFGGRFYDDRITRLRLKQAFGRLVRRADDHGVFVLLDPMMPSRLFGAFPKGVIPERVGLAEAVRRTAAFLFRQG
ncbi:ATP-dependent DNA helicase [Magnetospirillum molischianum]|uniref:Rad3-related DNA helicase n=1 Tax=Magnetospirillum molischianum DSM 120 TaxID=1150626 RepID=H8FNW5_MAGML|nr:ATP-dependent DNA helicase [Magnetospirillum molischianum]CCG40053.1 Rad3-related DNA helicase [Magnetospirillum molischianum DSM 120]